jgi:branched-chain amino acid transport system substrate-binding protein
MRKLLFTLLALAIVASLILSGCSSSSSSPQAKSGAPSKIVFGQSLGMSGPFAGTANAIEVPNLKLWIQEVNANGGLFLKDFNKKVPVDLIQYDDKSDLQTLVQLDQKLITQDKVDFMLPPSGTDGHNAIFSLFDQYKYPYTAFTTIVSMDDMKNMGAHPYRFIMFPDLYKMDTPLVEMAKEANVKTVALIYVNDQMGINYAAPMPALLKDAGINLVLNKSYPITTTDLSELLKEVKSLNPDALICLSYPGDSVLITQQSKVIGLNPGMFFVGIGGAMAFYRDQFGGKLDGVMTWGGLKPNLTPHIQDYFNKFKVLNKMDADFYSSSWAYAAYEVMGMAIENAGSLDREKVRQSLMNDTFKNTVMGVDIKFDNYFNQKLPSYVGQWQKGVLEPMWPKDVRTAKLLAPKPAWQ